MKVVRFHEQGGLEVLKYDDAPDPQVGPGQVLVRVRAAAANHVDLWVREVYPVSLPHIPGSDGAGEVVEVGPGVTTLRVGDRVAIYPGVTCNKCDFCLAGESSACVDFGVFGVRTDGTFAELTVVEEENAFPIAPTVTFEEAAAFPVVYLTAWHSLINRAGLRAGETVLIHAASSGTGTAAIQLAKFAGARVIAATGEGRKFELAKDIGADNVISNRTPDWPDHVMALTQGKGVDVVVDHLGPVTFANSLSCLNRLGRLVTFGATTGADVGFDLRQLYSRQLSIIGSMAGNRDEFSRLLRLLEKGLIKPVIDRVLPLSEAKEADRMLAEGSQFGKIVLLPAADRS